MTAYILATVCMIADCCEIGVLDTVILLSVLSLLTLKCHEQFRTGKKTLIKTLELNVKNQFGKEAC